MYLAPQSIPCATVLTLGNKVVLLYCPVILFVLLLSSSCFVVTVIVGLLFLLLFLLFCMPARELTCCAGVLSTIQEVSKHDVHRNRKAY